VILAALNNYYERLKDNPDSGIPLGGFSRQKIHFALVLDRQGNLLQVQDVREVVKGKAVPKSLVVPEPAKKSVNIVANFMWGATGYVLGADNKEKPDRARQTFEAFRLLHHQLGDNVDDDGMKALLRFLDNWSPDMAEKLENWDEIAGLNLVFRLDRALEYLHDRPLIKEAWLSDLDRRTSEKRAVCLVTGKDAPIARLHPDIKGVRGAQTKGASVVSFNLDAFCSYGKEQSFNAPVGERVAFAYTTALNELLRYEKGQRVQIGDATTVFWTERDSPIEGFMGYILDPRDDRGDVAEVRRFLEAVREGKMPSDIDGGVRFYILGLSPNAARLAVRFWQVSSVGEISSMIGTHFNDLAITKSFPSDPDFPGMWQMLRETAAQGNLDNVSPNLAGAFMRSILTGAAYPQALLSAIILRIRADQTVNYLRAAMIKACLVRRYRLTGSEKKKEVTMALDTKSTNIAYRLGRLFAVLERTQRDAVPGANTTIRDRFYGAASATPRVVFPQLLRLAQHHIQKADYGARSDKLIEEIISGIGEFPAHLTLDDQGFFALGYYHQRQSFYSKPAELAKEENA